MKDSIWSNIDDTKEKIDIDLLELEFSTIEIPKPKIVI